MARPSLYMTKSRHVKNGRVYEYAYVRYEAWDPAKGRTQPRNLVSLGRTEHLDAERVESIADFLRAWVRKDSALPFEALRERLEGVEPTLRILCSRDFGMRFLVEQAWADLGYADAVRQLHSEPVQSRRFELAIFAMVLVQLVAPQSKRAGLDWADIELFFPEANALALADLYSAMDALAAGYESVEAKLNETLRARGLAPTELATDSTNVICHIRYDDVERAEIEADRQARGLAKRKAVVNDPPIRMRGKSKAKRNDLPQVRIEAVLGDNGIIVHHQTTAGNVSDQTQVGLNLEALQRLGYQGVSWTADAGYSSAKNRDLLRAAGFEYVSGEGVARSAVVKKVLQTAGRYAPHPDKPEISFKCVRAEATEEARGTGKSRIPGPVRLYVIRRNAHEEAHANYRIDRHLNKVEAAIAKGGDEREKLLRHPTFRKYVRRDGRKKNANGRAAGDVILDRDAIEHARHLAGKSVIACDDTDVRPLVVDDLYRMLFDVERVFRDLKSTIDVGPIRHRKACRIEAHVMIAIMALNLGRWLSMKSGQTIEALRRMFANLRIQEVDTGGATYWQRTELEPGQRDAILKLGFDLPPRQFTATLVDAFKELTTHNHRTPP